eukprot:TRINITY_DN2057_c0_g1_i1.p2 TRINITY_DN2057_c0_g1~~TRINITY_DN2057_c0_g1_i1.p2  ORF type:complete len:211 (+),score=92.78 TRINITY_DN2057_c0_g1_i1:61-693(+)
MGGKSSKPPPKPVIVEKDSPAALRLKEAALQVVFDYYKDSEGLWGYEAVRQYMHDVEGKEVDRDEWAAMRMRVGFREDAPYSGLDATMVTKFFNKTGLELDKFFKSADLVGKLQELRDGLQEAQAKQVETEKMARRLKARNEALKDRCAGMNKRLKDIKTHFGGNSCDMSSMCSFEDASSLADAEFLLEMTPTRPRAGTIDAAESVTRRD